MNAAPPVPRPHHRRASVAAVWTRAQSSPFAFDVAFAAVTAVVTLIGAVTESHPTPTLSGLPRGQHVPLPPAAAYLLVVAAALVLIWRRRRPELVLAASTAAVVAYTCLGYVNGAALLSPVLAVYAVAVAVPIRRTVMLSVATMAALMGASAAFDPLGSTGGGFILIPGEVAAALFFGLWVSTSRAYVSRETAEQARRAVDAERLRIARELHDVVAHTMATIHVQAAVAAHVIEEQPAQAAQALETIKQISKEALGELRGILNVLRQADESDPIAPAPGLAQLDSLIDGTTRAGLPTELSIHGHPQPLSPTADLAAYRIVQESLTNALRHAGPTNATVTITYAEDHLTLEIVNSGAGHAGGRPGPGNGHGIRGMRERAHAVGGTLEAGPRPAGGFGVLARLPLQVSP